MSQSVPSQNGGERWSRANASIDRRATPREQVLLPALLVEAGGTRRPCVVLDRSLGGLRIQLPTPEPVSDKFAVVDLVSGVGHEVEVVWRHPPGIGLRTLRTYDLNAALDGRGAELQQIWNAALR
jgi:hypothetical protein